MFFEYVPIEAEIILKGRVEGDLIKNWREEELNIALKHLMVNSIVFNQNSDGCTTTLQVVGKIQVDK